MRVPIDYREADETEEQGFDAYSRGIIGAGVLLSALVWALAIAKLIDLSVACTKSVLKTPFRGQFLISSMVIQFLLIAGNESGRRTSIADRDRQQIRD